MSKAFVIYIRLISLFAAKLANLYFLHDNTDNNWKCILTVLEKERKNLNNNLIQNLNARDFFDKIIYLYLYSLIFSFLFKEEWTAVN